jgi:hypothetical protein
MVCAKVWAAGAAAGTFRDLVTWSLAATSPTAPRFSIADGFESVRAVVVVGLGLACVIAGRVGALVEPVPSSRINASGATGLEAVAAV